MHRQSNTHIPCFDYTLTTTTVTFPILKGRHEGRLLLLTLRKPQVSTIPQGSLHKEAGMLVSLDCSDEKQEFSRHPESVNLLWVFCHHTDVNAAIPNSSHYTAADAAITSLWVEHGSQPTMEYMCLAVCAYWNISSAQKCQTTFILNLIVGIPRRMLGRWLSQQNASSLRTGIRFQNHYVKSSMWQDTKVNPVPEK